MAGARKVAREVRLGWVAEISPREPRISVVPFSTSRPRMRAVALALIL